MASAYKNSLPKQPNRSLIDGLRVLQSVMSANEAVRVVDIAKSLDMEPTRAHRLLRTLSALGYLRQVRGRRYAGGPAVPILASQALQASGFASRTLPVLEDLLERNQMLVAYGLLWERTVSYLYHARPGVALESALVGHRVLPATRSRLGMAMLSKKDDEEIRELYSGHAIEKFSSVEALIKELTKYRKAGYVYFNGKGREESSIAVTLPGNPSAAIALGGEIPPHEKGQRLADLRRTAELIESRQEAD